MKNLLYHIIGIFFIGTLSVFYSLILQTNLAIKGQYFCLSVLIVGVVWLLGTAAHYLKRIDLFWLCVTLALAQSLMCEILITTDRVYPHTLQDYSKYFSVVGVLIGFLWFVASYAAIAYSLKYFWKILKGKFQNTHFAVYITTTTLIITLLLLNYYRPWESPKDILVKFYEHGNDSSFAVAEDMLMDPLILGGQKVVPLLLEEISNKDMLYRRYAIGFLGLGAYKQAIPVLTDILVDETELDIFRGDALESLYLIDKQRATNYAQHFFNRDDFLGLRAKEICSVNCRISRDRSYLNAFIGVHK